METFRKVSLDKNGRIFPKGQCPPYPWSGESIESTPRSDERQLVRPALAGCFSRHEALKDETNDEDVARGFVCQLDGGNRSRGAKQL